MFTRINTPCSRLLLLSIRCLDRKGASREFHRRSSQQPSALVRLLACLPACRRRYILLQESIRGRQSSLIHQWPSRRVVLTRAMRLGASLVDRKKKNPSKEPPKPANQPTSPDSSPSKTPTTPLRPPGDKGIAERPPAQNTPVHRRCRSSVSLFYHVIPLGSLACLTFTLGSAL